MTITTTGPGLPGAPYVEYQIKAVLVPRCAWCGETLRIDDSDYEGTAQVDDLAELLEHLQPSPTSSDDDHGGYIAGTVMPSRGPRPQPLEASWYATWTESGWRALLDRARQMLPARLVGRRMQPTHDVVCMACATRKTCADEGHDLGMWMSVYSRIGDTALAGMQMTWCERRWCSTRESRVYQFADGHPLDGRPDGDDITITGTIAAVDSRTTRQDRPWAIALLNVDGHHVPLQVFPTVYDGDAASLLTEGAAVTVAGRVDLRAEPSVNVKDLRAVETV